MQPITLADRRTVPEATGQPDKLSFKRATESSTAAGQMIAVDEAEGVVTAIVSVTGVIDEVDDIIEPGAYRETLLHRRPKVCWAHDWKQPTGRVLYIEELLPGDSRLPTKTRDGKAWPKAAGALVTTMQFNMRSTEGKQAFEAVRFYSETGECEWSIGYQVPEGKATRHPRTHVRRIKALELYEVSTVLFGAHTMTGTLSIKEAYGLAVEHKMLRPPGHRGNVMPLGMTGTTDIRRLTAKDALAALQTKATDQAPTDQADDHADDVMVAVYPDGDAASKVAAHIAGPDDTEPREDLHVTLAYLGNKNDLDLDADEIRSLVTGAVEGVPVLKGTIGGIGQFPGNDDEEPPTWAPVDVPGLTMLRELVAGALGDAVATDHDFTPHITLGFGIGIIDPVPPTPVEFSAVRVVYGTEQYDVALGQAGIPAEDKGMTAEERRRKPTMPGQGDRFPIGNVDDLRNAVRAFGRAKDKDKARRWIIRRARELNAINVLPDSWNVTKGLDVDSEEAETEAALDADQAWAEGRPSDAVAAEVKAVLDYLALDSKATTPGGRQGDDSPVGTPGGRQNWVDQCFPGDVRVNSGSRVRSVYRYWHEGLLVNVRTMSGIELSATPNHPLLTSRGWQPIERIQLGEKLVLAPTGERVGGREPGVEGVPPSISEVYGAADQTGSSERVRADAVHFHGDVPHSDVDVVEVGVELSDVLNTVSIEKGRDGGLVGLGGASGSVSGGGGGANGDPPAGAEVADPERGEGVPVVGEASLTVVAERDAVVFEDAPDDRLVGGEARSDVVGRHAGSVLGDDRRGVRCLDVTAAEGVAVAVGSAVDSRLVQASVESGTSDTELLRKLRDGRTGEVAADEVVAVELRAFQGHVYDLSTEAGWYAANGVIVHNSGGLPRYIREVAHALIRRGMSKDRAIATAVATMKRWAAGAGNVSAKVQAAAAKAVAEWEAMKAKANKSVVYDPDLDLDTKGWEAPVPAGGAPFPYLPGSYEVRMNMVRDAVTEALRGEPINDDGDKYEWDHVTIDGTWDDRVIASRVKWSGGTDERETYEMTYRCTDAGVELGEPEPCTLQVVATTDDGVESDDYAPIADALPLAEAIESVAFAIKTTRVPPVEGKAGRVLSGRNERRLRLAMQNLLDVLAAAGVLIDPERQPGEDTVKPATARTDDARREVDPSIDLASTAPSTVTKGLTRADVDATLRELGVL